MTARQIAEAAERVAQSETIKAVARDAHVSQCTLSNYLEETGHRQKLDYQDRRGQRDSARSTALSDKGAGQEQRGSGCGGEGW